MNIKLRQRKLSRSTGGDIFIFLMLGVGAAFTAAPLLLVLMNAFKPMDELFLFPPQFFVRNPTLQNFQDMFVMMGDAFVPISRYFFNSILIVAGGMIGNIILGSMAAYAIAIHDFPGKGVFK